MYMTKIFVIMSRSEPLFTSDIPDEGYSVDPLFQWK